MPLSRFFNAVNMSFNAIRENKILAKIPDLKFYSIMLPLRGLIWVFCCCTALSTPDTRVVNRETSSRFCSIGTLVIAPKDRIYWKVRCKLLL